MNKADSPRVLASITATAFVVAVLAFSAAVFFESIRWLSAGMVVALVTSLSDRRRFTLACTARDEATHNRMLRIITYWQADVHAINNDTPRPDPRGVVFDQPPRPRESREQDQDQHSDKEA